MKTSFGETRPRGRVSPRLECSTSLRQFLPIRFRQKQHQHGADQKQRAERRHRPAKVDARRALSQADRSSTGTATTRPPLKQKLAPVARR